MAQSPRQRRRAQQRVAELHFTVTPKNAQEKVRIAIGYRMVTK
jgi:hypothetical protein